MENNKGKKMEIPGTKLFVNNTQLLISSGIVSLDEIIGGGIPVGTVTLIEEDTCGAYSKLMLQYYIAEGILNGHSIFIGSKEFNSSSLLSSLPRPISVENENKTKESLVTTQVQQLSNNDELKIAWRYKNVPRNLNKSEKLTLSHYYDLSKIMDSTIIEQSDINCWPLESSNKYNNPFNKYEDLLNAIVNKANESKFSLKSFNVDNNSRSILRIVLHGIGSPLWFSKNQNRDLLHFIYLLRCIARSALVSIFITIPSKIMSEDIVERCIHSSDFAFRLETFSGTSLDNIRALSDYQGFFHFVKLSPINTLIAKELGPTDFAFKLRRKKFSIEELHLPPELQESNEREQDDVPSFSCASTSKHLYEF